MSLIAGPPNQTPNNAAGAIQSYLRAVYDASQGAWRKAFGMDGVRSRWAAEAVAAALRLSAGWVNDSVATQGGHGLNPNAYLQLFSLPTAVIPDGWTLLDPTHAPLLSKVTSGVHGPNALRVTNNTGGNITVTFRSGLIPVHPDWVYKAEGTMRWSVPLPTAGAGGSVNFNYYNQAKVALGTDPVARQPAALTKDAWADLRQDGGTTFDTTSFVPANRVAGGANTRFIQLEVGISVPDGETADWDYAALRRVPFMAKLDLQNSVALVLGGVFRYVDFDSKPMARGPGTATTATAAVQTTLAATTAKITIPYDTHVRVGAGALFSGGPTETRVEVYKNDNTANVLYTTYDNLNTGRWAGGAGNIVPVSKGDTIKMGVQHNSSTPETLTPSATNWGERTYLYVEEVPFW